MANIINRSSQNNYVCDNKIFMLGKFGVSETAELIGNLSNIIDSLPWKPIFSKTPLFKESKHLTNPYNLSDEYPPVIDIYINSCGGINDSLNAITSLLALAQAKGAIIRTTVMGRACSCASMLAVQGTPGFRIMYDYAYNLIHFGTSEIDIRHIDEIDVKSNNVRKFRQNCANIYLKNTKIDEQTLNKFFTIEGSGELYSKECLALGICDWILTASGKFIHAKRRSR